MLFYNLDTISFLERDSRIVQLSAIRGEEEFNKYLLTIKPMSAKAKQITGIQVANHKMKTHVSKSKTDNWNTSCHSQDDLDDVEVDVVSIIETMKQFLKFLKPSG